jgi:hypothetical protein
MTTRKHVFYGILAVCVLMLAFSHNAGAAPRVLPPDIVSVPDGGATIMLLGAALGALGMRGAS